MGLKSFLFGKPASQTNLYGLQYPGILTDVQGMSQGILGQLGGQPLTHPLLTSAQDIASTLTPPPTPFSTSAMQQLAGLAGGTYAPQWLQGMQANGGQTGPSPYGIFEQFTSAVNPYAQLQQYAQPAQPATLTNTMTAPSLSPLENISGQRYADYLKPITGPSSQAQNLFASMDAMQAPMRLGERQTLSHQLAGLGNAPRRSSAGAYALGSLEREQQDSRNALFSQIAMQDLARQQGMQQWAAQAAQQQAGDLWGRQMQGAQYGTGLTQQNIANEMARWQQQFGAQQAGQGDVFQQQQQQAAIATQLANLGLGAQAQGFGQQQAGIQTQADLLRALFGMGTQAQGQDWQQQLDRIGMMTGVPASQAQYLNAMLQGQLGAMQTIMSPTSVQQNPGSQGLLPIAASIAGGALPYYAAAKAATPRYGSTYPSVGDLIG